MRKSDELKQKRASYFKELKELSLKKELSIVDKDLLNTLEKNIDQLSYQIMDEVAKEQKQAENAMKYGIPVDKGLSVGDERDLSKYSFSRALLMSANLIPMDGIESEMNQEARSEITALGQKLKGFGIPSIVLNRASTGQNVTTPADGGYLVQDSSLNLIVALKNKLVLTQLGARFLTGLTGDLPLVTPGAFTAEFVAEGDAITKTKIDFANKKMSPHRLGCLGAVSKQLLYQSSADIERLIIDEFTSAISLGIEQAAISGSGSGANPTGILSTANIKSVVAGDPDGASLTWDDIVKLETEVNKANGSGMKQGYLTNSTVIGALKTTEKVAGTAKYLIDENGLLNGKKVLDTNAVPNNLTKGGSSGILSAMIFGSWDSLLIGQWGGLDLTSDPYTRKSYGELELQIDAFIDIAVSNPYRFSAVKDIL